MNKQTDSQCILCGNINWEDHLILGEYKIIKCKVCGLGQTYPFPSTTEQSEVNKEVYSLESRLQTYDLRLEELSRRYEKQLDEILLYRSTQGKKLLDVGCSLGFFLTSARKMGFDVAGVELSLETAKYAKEKQALNVFCGTLEQANYENEQFDVVTLWDVLEHVPDPKAMLIEIHRILAKGGLLVIQSPNMNSVMAETGQEKWGWWLVPDHIYHFTPHTLDALISQMNFAVSASYTWEPSVDFVMNWLNKSLQVNTTDKKFKGRLLRRLVRVGSNILSLLATPIQYRAWKINKGGLITLFAHKIR